MGNRSLAVSGSNDNDLVSLICYTILPSSLFIFSSAPVMFVSFSYLFFFLLPPVFIVLLLLMFNCYTFGGGSGGGRLLFQVF
jgi:hypothetical protein